MRKLNSPPVWHQPSLEQTGSVSVADRKFSATNFDPEFNWQHLAATSVDQVNVRSACQNRVSQCRWWWWRGWGVGWSSFWPIASHPPAPTLLPEVLSPSGASSGSHRRLTGSCLLEGDTWVTDPHVHRGRRQTGRHVGYSITRSCTPGMHACVHSRESRIQTPPTKGV